MAVVESSTESIPKSLVTDVLEKAGQLEQEDFHSYVKKTLHKAEEIKAEVFKIIYEDYSFGEFQDLNSTTCELNWKVENLLNDINNTSKNIRGTVFSKLDSAATEYNQLSQDLCQTEAIGKVLTRLCKIHASLDAFPSKLDSEEYLEAAKIIDRVNEDLSLLPKAGQESKIYTALKEELVRIRSQLINKLESVWLKCMIWNTPTTASLDSIHSHLKTHLTLNTETKMENIINAMQSLDILEKRVKIFGKKMIQFLFRPLLVFPSLKPLIEAKKQDVIISLVKDSTRVKVTDPGKVYMKILEILDQVKTQFQDNSSNENSSDETAEGKEVPSVHLFSLLGSIIWPVLAEDIIKDCLAKTIPNTSSQLEKYQEVISNTKDFEDKLKEAGFIKESPSFLTKYVQDISIHFGNKKCQDLLVSARDLMKDDIHNTVVIDLFSDTAVLCSLGELQAAINGSNKEPGKISPDKGLSPLTFQLPKCQISVTTKKLMNLAYATLLEATKSSTQSAIQLFYTVRNMFELFCNVVPTYHQESLTSLPQLSALHHNNCMYISHLLLTMGHQFKGHLPEPLSQGAATFIDLVPVIRSLGENCLLDQLRRQRSELLGIIKNAQGFADANEDERRTKIERAIKQVLHQLLHLKKIWLDVLPENLFYQSLGSLLDAVLENITSQVLHLEDISSEEASHLHSLLSIISRTGPDIFQITKDAPVEDITIYVPHWSKFLHTIAALEASLQDLADRWGEGKGPLAHDFTANEVRGLIRALFQNTDRRAAVLAKIKAVQ